MEVYLLTLKTSQETQSITPKHKWSHLEKTKMSSDCPKVTALFVISGTKLGVLCLPTLWKSPHPAATSGQTARESQMPNSRLRTATVPFLDERCLFKGLLQSPGNIRPAFLFILFSPSQDHGHPWSLVGLPISKGRWAGLAWFQR